jgi:predicted AAA+ superfamily ATPase
MSLQSRKYLSLLESWLFKGKVLILYGARQVGKTSLLRLLAEKYTEMQIFSCENPTVIDALQSKNLRRIELLFGSNKIIALDEAQKIEGIGEILKYIHDSGLNYQIIATGSSSFDLANKVTEPLTGRNIKFQIYPYSLSELQEQKSGAWLLEHLSELLIFGQYPAIVEASLAQKPILLSHLASDYLFQDILQHERLHNSSQLLKLLKALAYQLGNEVSYLELAQTIGLAPQTIEKYIDLLEKNFVIITLNSFSRNLRNELKKSKKIYFTDLGLRNALISNFSDLEYRQDKGALWENFCILERLKKHSIEQRLVNVYFWRTYDQAEIDLIEEYDGKLHVFEFKYNPKKSQAKIPQSFLDAYPIEQSHIIHTGNFESLMD